MRHEPPANKKPSWTLDELEDLAEGNDAARRTDEARHILIGTDEYRVNDEALEAIASDPGVYTRGGELVRVVGDGMQIEVLSRGALRELLTRRVAFQRETSAGVVAAHPPDWCVSGLLARRSFPGVKPLAGIVSTPILRLDGSVFDSPGYDEKTQLYYSPTAYCLTPDPMGDAQTLEQARASLNEILEVVRDFEFARPAHRAAWVAAVLTMIARHLIPGDAPLILIDANIPGAGKGLLADVAAEIACGRPLPRYSQPGDDLESRKRITSIAIAGMPAVLLDNLTGPLRLPSLDAALTCNGVWADRVLGASIAAEWPMRTVWWATGNNVALGTDTVRRTMHIRLHVRTERPEERDDFHHADLRAWVRSNRTRLLRACLRMLRAYLAAERPQSPIPTWGSYEAWSGLVRQCVVWLGLPDPAESRAELRVRADADRGPISALFHALVDLDPKGAGLTAADIRAAAESRGSLRAALVELLPPRGDESLPSVRRIGSKLRELRDRVIDGRALDAVPDRTGTNRWRVREESAGDAGHAGDDFPGDEHDGREEDLGRARQGMDHNQHPQHPQHVGPDELEI